MKYIACMFLVLLAFTVNAQDVVSNSGASSNAQQNVQAGASNQGVSNTTSISSTSPSHTTVRAAPGFGLGAFSSSFASDYCMGTSQIGGSGLGFSIGGGTPTPDKNCQLLRAVDMTMRIGASVDDGGRGWYAAATQLGYGGPNGNTAMQYSLKGAAMREQAARYVDAATKIMCQLSPEVRASYESAGLVCSNK